MTTAENDKVVNDGPVITEAGLARAVQYLRESGCLYDEDSSTIPLVVQSVISLALQPDKGRQLPISGRGEISNPRSSAPVG